MKIKDANILIIPGERLDNADHWQVRWAGKMSNAKHIQFENPNDQTWVERIEADIAASDARSIIIAHDLGVVATVQMMAAKPDLMPRIAGAFLVSPPDLVRKNSMFSDYPSAPLPCPSFLVGSRNDPQCDYQKLEERGADWGSFFVDAGENGHIDIESGHGPWPEGLMVFAEFMKRL